MSIFEKSIFQTFIIIIFQNHHALSIVSKSRMRPNVKNDKWHNIALKIHALWPRWAIYKLAEEDMQARRIIHYNLLTR